MFALAISFSVEFLIYLLQIWFLAEFIFYFVIKYLVSKILYKFTKPLPYDIKPKELILKILDCNDKLEIYDSQAFISGWFCGAPLRDIKYQNALDFFAWAMYARNFHELSSDEVKNIEDVLSLTQQRLHLPLEPGYNPLVRHIHMTLEPLHYLHRPLAMYVLIHSKNLITGIGLRAMGYKKYSFKTISYWYRPASTSTPTTNTQQDHHPTIFFHGITTGWAPYALLIEYLKDHRTVLLIDLDAIQMNSLNFYMPSPEYYCACVRSVLDLHEINRVNLVGHSFGTITTGWFAKYYPSYTAHITLIDPVSLLLSQPNVAYNFLYRPPVTLMQWLLYLGASSELTIAYALRRNFWWYRNQLWLEDLDPTIGVHASLAGRDEVCDSSVVREYLMICAKERLHLRATQELEQQQGVQGDGGHMFDHKGPFPSTQMTVSSTSSPVSISKSMPKSPSSSRSIPVAEITFCYRDSDSHAQVLLSAPCLKKLAQEILRGQLNAFWKE
jgi:pimeloyl-ACP methyl ester carboxylesterase